MPAMRRQGVLSVLLLSLLLAVPAGSACLAFARMAVDCEMTKAAAKHETAAADRQMRSMGHEPSEATSGACHEPEEPTEPTADCCRSESAAGRIEALSPVSVETFSLPAVRAVGLAAGNLDSAGVSSRESAPSHSACRRYELFSSYLL